MLLKDDHEEKRRKSIKRERRKVREKGGKEAPMQMENIKMYEKTEKSDIEKRDCIEKQIVKLFEE